MRSGLKRTAVFCVAAMLFGTAAISSAATLVPKRVYGNVGYFYTGAEADGGATTNSSLTTVSLNMDSYIWRPWFADLNFGATSSMSRSETVQNTSSLDLLSSYLNFSMMSRSRYPFRLTYNTSDNVTDWNSGKITLLSLGPQYKTRYLNARQSIITLAGNRADAWYTKRTRNYSGVELVDDTMGAKIKMRGRAYNLYANSTYQERTNSVSADQTKNFQTIATHNFFPSKEFYIKTQVTSQKNDVGSEKYFADTLNAVQTNVGMFRNRTTRTDQLTSFMYWRPDYKAYTATGGVRMYRRNTADDLGTLQDVIQQGVDANLAGNYKINRRLWATLSANAAGLYNSGQSDYVSVTSNQNALLNYRSDNLTYREYQYNWNASGGFTNQVGLKNPSNSVGSNVPFQPSNRQNFSSEYAQSYSAGAGHNLTRGWVTGNRSILRMNLNQAVREYIQTNGKQNSMGITHSATINWNESMKKGKFYSQLTLMDSRNLGESTESQLLNLQASRIVPINRLSSWGSHLSAQSSRRYSKADGDQRFRDGFLTTVNGRVNYNHTRMFGIYKLKFRSRLEINSTASRLGEGRKQADWESRLGYNIGKLSTALIGRKIWSDSGLGTGVVIFQVNRSF